MNLPILMETFDFSRSYLRFRVDLEMQAAITLSHQMPTSENNVRINLESVCDISNMRTGENTQYVLGASCKTERVGGPGDLWLCPNADFCLIASSEEFLILKSWQKCDMGVLRHPPTLGAQPERQSGLVKEAWTDFSIAPRAVEGHKLKTLDEIIAAIKSDAPLASRTEYSSGDYHVVISHPIKTINYSAQGDVFQTDTGPIILPDLSTQRLEKEERFIGCFDLAYSAFNTCDWAEFIVNVPTLLNDALSVNHYSQTRRVEGTCNAVIKI